MTFQRKCFLVFIFGLFNFLLIVGFLIIRDSIYEYNLRKEINDLSELDITKDRFNTEIKTKSDYGLVEEAIKLYLDDYAINLHNILIVVNSDEFRGLFSIENYQTDGPDFNESLSYINRTRNKFNADVDLLIDKSNEDVIKKNILNYTKDEYFISLYNELMFGKNTSIDFDENIKMLNNLKKDVNNVFDISVDMFNFLNVNKENYKIEDGEIKFENDNLLNQYNSYIEKIK